MSRIEVKIMRKPTVITLLTLVLLGAASLALAASGEGGHADSGVLLKDFLYRIFNFGVTVALLAYFVTKPIRKGMAGRRQDIEKTLDQARTAQQQAEAKFAEYDRKLTQASAEIEEICASIRREGEVEKEAILAAARESSAKILKDAERSAALEVSRARAELRQEAVRMAVSISEELLKKNFTADDQKRLVTEYIQKVGELH